MLEHQRSRVGHLLAAPALIVITAMSVVPLVMAFFLSFTRYDLLSAPQFVGLDNYVQVLTDPVFGQVTVNTLVFAVGQVAVGIVVTFLAAMLFNQRLAGNALMRTTVYLPQAMSYVTVALLWSFLYDPFNGPLNAVIQYLGGPQVNFLTETGLAMPSIMAMSLWRNFGYFMVILLAGLKAIPPELLEAAQIDGAGALRRLIHVTLPQMKNALLFVTVTWFMGGLQMFTQAYVMTQGGPENATRTVVYEIYRSAFSDLNIGRACAVSVLLFLFVAAFGLPLRVVEHLKSRHSARQAAGR
ncbi:MULTISPECIES: sugar ABC transporter permease [unclassified Actinomyces]|uniref:carbohydrate ABC transporter permease n=1 Tax=unclassified Actinomyces TaxID=2609248 RepID=UPI0020172444|nr:MULTISPECIES: sugar ABC transporter permease [unclassified Actinomyces]MCL3776661.1 sugar ABC transporter permease [Actinomyces sp. AC-20-1]MCL3790185.1 sugar ABC transporter permease [Actinomyces sp. 187325]MCL3792471.1 sugar ABC transporter permease [Actinomyces sp. 186855]MCL3795014.1 sugar ABC transporter permease [Actinomyces sp. 217892]